jgi:hypothetical protein
MSAGPGPYRFPAPESSLADAQAAYIKAERLADKARKDYLEAARTRRAVWAPRIFSALVGLGASIAVAQCGPRACEAIVRPSPCHETAVTESWLEGQVARCESPEARLELKPASGIAYRCVCPRAVDGGAP